MVLIFGRGVTALGKYSKGTKVVVVVVIVVLDVHNEELERQIMVLPQPLGQAPQPNPILVHEVQKRRTARTVGAMQEEARRIGIVHKKCSPPASIVPRLRIHGGVGVETVRKAKRVAQFVRAQFSKRRRFQPQALCRTPCHPEPQCLPS